MGARGQPFLTNHSKLIGFLSITIRPGKEEPCSVVLFRWEAKITLIPKEGENLEYSEVYCPISLLNTDYKILMSILADRVSRIIGNYVTEDQIGFIRNRNLEDNIRKMMSIIYKVQVDKNPVHLVLLDAEKAFDKIEWLYLKWDSGKIWSWSGFWSLDRHSIERADDKGLCRVGSIYLVRFLLIMEYGMDVHYLPCFLTSPWNHLLLQCIQKK